MKNNAFWSKCGYVCLLSCVWLFTTPWTVALQAPLFMEFSRQEYWSGLPFPLARDHPDPGVAENKYTDPKQKKNFVNILTRKKCTIVFQYTWVTNTAYWNKLLLLHKAAEFINFFLTGMTYNLAPDLKKKYQALPSIRTKSVHLHKELAHCLICNKCSVKVVIFSFVQFHIDV